jgi:hypothetical protein
MPSIFAGLKVDGTEDFAGCGESPTGRELLFLIDGFGADLLAQYGEHALSLIHI